MTGIIQLVNIVYLLTVVAVVTAAARLCRSKFGLHEPETFRLHSCAWCYYFLFRSRKLVPSYYEPFLIAMVNGTGFSKGTKIVPNVENETNRGKICQTLSADQCDRWQMCCQAAHTCCQKQISAPDTDNRTCKRTWDGYGCWEDTSAGTNAFLSCPSFLQYSVPTRQAVKTCRGNGTWLQMNKTEWTDYTPCLDKESLVKSIYLSLGCNIASILFLVPAFSIFFLYRSLRRQHRIRLHMNFFLSFVVSDVMTILWDMLVTYDRLSNDNISETVLYQNGVGCKQLSFLRIYFKSSNYLWMFCEGFYLHRLISNAFKPPKNLKPLYCLGWGIPLVYTMVYSILRAVYANESCWARSFGHYEWIIYAPNLLCLVVNLFFLCNILRILLTQLQSHPNEPSNFRRALKATFVLIPLFGIQLFVTLYRIPTGTPGAMEYEMFTVFVINSQGFFVALIFCFFNGEVASHLRRSCTRMRILRSLTDMPRGTTTATSINFTQPKEESQTENGTFVCNDSPYSSPAVTPKADKRPTLELYDKKYIYQPMGTHLRVDSSKV